MIRAKFAMIGICALAVLSGAPRAADAATALRNGQIDIVYGEPQNPAFLPIYEGLKSRKALEELRAFLAPLQLPKRITIEVKQCGAQDSPRQPDGPATICYEYVARLIELAAAIPADGAAPNGLTRSEAVFGAFVQAALTRTASVVYDALDVPIWGREPDAADRLAAFLMLQFGPKAARKLMDGATFFFNASDRSWTGVDFSDADSTQSQRYYNFQCMAFGGDPKLFGDFDGSTRKQGRGDRSNRMPILSGGRAVRCEKEYREALYAFQTLILPHVDRVLMREVLARDWLAPFDE